MLKTLSLCLLVACSHAGATTPSPRNAAEVLLTAEQPDLPHGAVGSEMALAVIPNQAGDVFEVCYSKDGKHTVCFDPVAAYVAREKAKAEAQQKQQADAAAKVKADAEAAEKAKAEAPKLKK